MDPRGGGDEAAPPRSRRRKLNYDKCVFCRKDKNKCEPHDRIWPDQKCNRCETMGLDCSGNARVAPASSEPPNERLEATRPLVAVTEHDEDGLQLLACLSAKASWLSRLERLCGHVEAIERNYAEMLGNIGNAPDLSDQRSWVTQRRQNLCRTARAALDSPSLSVTIKSGIAGVLDSIVTALHSRSGGHSSELGYFLDDRDLHAEMITSLRAAGHAASAMVLQERFLDNLAGDTSPETWKEEFQLYCDLYKESRSILVTGAAADKDQLPIPPDDSLPFMTNKHALYASFKHFPTIHAKDFFGRNLLHLALYNGHIESIDVIIRDLSLQALNSKEYFGRTPLHIAATLGYDDAVRCLLAADVDTSPTEYSDGLTPLQCGAAAGHSRVTKLIFETLSNDPSITKGSVSSQIQSALDSAAANGHSSILRLFRADIAHANRTTLEPSVPIINVVTDNSGYDSIAKLAVDWMAESPHRREDLEKLSDQDANLQSEEAAISVNGASLSALRHPSTFRINSPSINDR